MRKAFYILLCCAGILVGHSLKGQAALDSLALVKADSGLIYLSNFKQATALGLIFTSNHCIYSKKYEDRLVELITEYQAKGVKFLLINSNSPVLSSDDRMELMQARAAEKAFPCPYVKDPKAGLANHLGATKNPEVFLGKWKGNEFVIVYSGKIDDNPLMVSRVGTHYFREALDYILEGKTEPLESVPSVGCGIKIE
jgi:hypothetical protein